MDYKKSTFSGDTGNCVTVAKYRKSTHSGTGGSCVEVADGESGRFLKDTKNPDVPPFFFNEDEWTAFISGVKAGEFD